MNSDNKVAQPQTKLLNLDIIRAIAVVMILLVHLEIFGWGGHGVELFLLLTGYTAFLSIDRHNDISPLTYYKRRLSRILPPYYGVVLIYFFIYLVVLKEQYSTSEILISLVKYFTLTTTLFPRGLIFWFYLGTTGTIVTIMMFYLLAPFLYKLINNFRRSLVAIIVAYILCHIWTKYLEVLYIGTPYAGRHPAYFIFLCFFGVAAYYAVKEGKKMQYITFLMLVGVACLIKDVYDTRMYWIVMVSTILLATDGIEKNLGKWKSFDFCANIVRFISKYSYSIYLGHPVGILIMKSLIDKETTTMPLPLYWLIEFGFFIVMSFIVYMCFEKPFAKLLSSKSKK